MKQNLFMAINMSVVFYILILVCHLASVSTNNTFQDIISCPGDVLTTKCTIMGDGATVWQGTAFQCSSSSNIILLLHSRFTGSHYPTASCNNGAIVARRLGIVNNSYISQLNVTVSPELNNTTVECWYDNYMYTAEIFIRSIQITVLATDSVKISNIGILNINSREVTFNWTQPDNAMCSVSHYELKATNCGRCPNETSRLDTQATCMEISTDGRLCTFSVQAIGTFNGSQTISITALLKVPDMLRVNVTHYRAANDQQEDLLRVLINEVAPFNISDEVDGSATSYTITYTDSTFSYICGSTVISASTCESGVCSDWFDIASSPCARSTNVTVTAFATNLLGDGPPSQPIQIVLLSNSEDAGYPVNEKLDLRFIVFSTVSSAANILLLASIFVIIAIVVRRRKSQRDDANSGNEGTEATAVYDEINLHPPSSADIDTKENVAYRQTIFK